VLIGVLCGLCQGAVARCGYHTMNLFHCDRVGEDSLSEEVRDKLQAAALSSSSSTISTQATNELPGTKLTKHQGYKFSFNHTTKYMYPLLLGRQGQCRMRNLP
jgi:hypothetical protein